MNKSLFMVVSLWPHRDLNRTGRKRGRTFMATHGVTRFDDEMFGGDDAAANLACSDHRLVWVRLRVPGQDDD